MAGKATRRAKLRKGSLFSPQTVTAIPGGRPPFCESPRIGGPRLVCEDRNSEKRGRRSICLCRMGCLSYLANHQRCLDRRQRLVQATKSSSPPGRWASRVDGTYAGFIHFLNAGDHKKHFDTSGVSGAPDAKFCLCCEIRSIPARVSSQWSFSSWLNI